MKTVLLTKIYFVRRSSKGRHNDIAYFFSAEKAHKFVEEYKDNYYGKLTVYEAKTLDSLIKTTEK